MKRTVYVEDEDWNASTIQRYHEAGVRFFRTSWGSTYEYWLAMRDGGISMSDVHRRGAFVIVTDTRVNVATNRWRWRMR